MVKELCFRCKRPVYPTDKIGPLKDGTLFHHGCFKCYICGSRLALKSYCHNRNDISDQEVYCINHAPQANPHDPVPHRSNLVTGSSITGSSNANGALHDSPQLSDDTDVKPLIGDMHIRHALKATVIQKPYPKIVHSGAKYVVDYDQQTRLELVHRKEEDDLYMSFSKKRDEEEQRFTKETKEEWEKALDEFSRKYEKDVQARGFGSPTSNNQARDDLIRQLTVKRDKRKETMRMVLKEKERAMTADLVDRQSQEMMDLFRQARQQCLAESQQSGGKNTNGYGSKSFATTTTQTNNGSRQDQGTASGSYQDKSPISYPSTPPLPFPPTNNKEGICFELNEFREIDRTAINIAQSEVHTFTDLVRALMQHCRNEVEIARAIYRWITVKNLNIMEFDDRIDADTPLGILRGIKYGTESYHVLFKRLCSYAGLHCVVIKGYSKSAGYQPGMTFDDGRFRNTWNAVYLEHGWRFVQCNWGARHLVNAKADGRSVSNGVGAGAVDNLRYEYDDHYFMTDPEHFIYEFYPAQSEWQLLKRLVTLREFENLPFVRSLFFRYGLAFADPNTRAVVHTDQSGAATVALDATDVQSRDLIFHYNLKFYDSDKQEFERGVNLKRFVMQSSTSPSGAASGTGGRVVFRVHAPCPGDFLLDVFANRIASDQYLAGRPMKFKSVCKLKIVCQRLNVVMVPLPDCASGEWGPAKAHRLFGLAPLSHPDAIVNVSGADVALRFRLGRPLAEFVACLHRNGADGKQLSKLVGQSMEGPQTVCFRIRFREEGQYGLDLYTRESNPPTNYQPTTNQAPDGGRSASDPNLLTHCCKYLINVRM